MCRLAVRWIVDGTGRRGLCHRLEPCLADGRHGTRPRRAVCRRLRAPDHRPTSDTSGPAAHRSDRDRLGDGRGPVRARCLGRDTTEGACRAEAPGEGGAMTSSSRLQGYPDPGPGLRLHLNENTGGCSAKVLEAIRRVDPRDVSTYPSYPDLIRACARHFKVDPEWILLTNGLDEGILMAAVGHIARARIHDAETIVPLPAFDPYPNATAAVGATTVRI